MYTMTIEDRPLYDPRVEAYALERPTLQQQANKLATMTFTIYPNHPEYANISDRKAVICVLLDGSIQVKLRVVTTKLTFRGGIEVKCEELAARLNDIVRRPGYYSGTPAAYLAELMTDFNTRYAAAIPEDSFQYLGSRVLRNGDSGKDVRELQTNLVYLGFALPKYGIDGAYGDETETKVRAFQKKNGLQNNGIFGVNDLAKLKELVYASRHAQDIPVDITFEAGNVEGIDTASAEYINDDYLNYWELIQNALVGKLGGYIVPRYTDDKIYIDYLDDDHLPLSGQSIVFGENLVDLYLESDAANTFSVLIPLGADVRATNVHTGQAKQTPLTIKSVNSGLDYLENEAGLALYGRREKTMRWDDIKDASELKTKGSEYLNANAVRMAEKIQLNAVDLKDAGVDVNALRWMTRVPAESPVHGLSEVYTVSQKTTSLGAPNSTKIQLGAVQESFTDRIAKNASQAAREYSYLSGRVFGLENPEPEE